MHSIEIPEKGIMLHYPQDGSEFERQQFIDFSGMVYLYMCGKLSWEEFKIRLSYRLLGLQRKASFEELKEHDLVLLDNITRISKLAEGFFYKQEIDGNVKNVIAPVFIDQKIPDMKIDWVKFIGPKMGLFNTVYGEYIQALNHFNDFSLKGLERDLDMMIATLYRPRKRFLWLKKRRFDYDGDVRRKFNPAHTERYAKKLTKLPIGVKYGIYLFFASCQHFITTNDSLDVGGGNSIDMSSLFSKRSGGTPSKNGLGMVGTLYDIAETNVFGNIEQTAKQNTYDVLSYMCRQQEKLSNKMTNAKN